MQRQLRVFFVFSMCLGCGTYEDEEQFILWSGSDDGIGGVVATDFKIPVPKGYSWEITQSWEEKCSECASKYHDYNYCNGTHTQSCCKYAIDFNLPFDLDVGVEVLSTANGYVKKSGFDKFWGYYTVIDHGNNVCSRYAHMQYMSNSELVINQYVCQGTVLGRIGSTGMAEGSHLHFQFEKCDTEESIRFNFTDGNTNLSCKKGNDVFSSGGSYNFLKLTNSATNSCKIPAASLDSKKWVNGACGELNSCPLNKTCNRSIDHIFSDENSMPTVLLDAVRYLYSECAIDGKSDGGFHGDDVVTRAEALKIALTLFEITAGCNGKETEPFSDVKSSDWFYGVVSCAYKHGIIEKKSKFYPNNKVNLAEALKILVESGVKSGKIQIQNSSIRHLTYFPKSHWAFKYAETLYYYGGFIGNTSSAKPENLVSRNAFALMAVALSPCYCKNVQCENGCECSQGHLACIPEEANNWEDTALPIPEIDGILNVDVNSFKTGDVNTFCYPDLSKNICSNTSTDVTFICVVFNWTDKVLAISYAAFVPETLGSCSVVQGVLGFPGSENYTKVEKKVLTQLESNLILKCKYPENIRGHFDLVLKNTVDPYNPILPVHVGFPVQESYVSGCWGK